MRFRPGSRAIAYLARATTVGRFTAPGARAELMYAPEVYGQARPHAARAGALMRQAIAPKRQGCSEVRENKKTRRRQDFRNIYSRNFQPSRLPVDRAHASRVAGRHLLRIKRTRCRVRGKPWQELAQLPRTRSNHPPRRRCSWRPRPSTRRMLLHFARSHATRRHGRGAEPDAPRVKGLARVKRDRVTVADDARALECPWHKGFPAQGPLGVMSMSSRWLSVRRLMIAKPRAEQLLAEHLGVGHDMAA